MSYFSKPLRSYVLVGIQFGCIGMLVVTGPLIPDHMGWMAMELLGVGLGLWAIWAMEVRHLQVLPDIKHGNPLTTRGPYHLIRHPMYTAVLLVFLAVMGDAFSWDRLGVWLILVVDLLVKLNIEEGLLVQHFPDYHRYQLRTTRLIPWIF